MGPNVDAQLHYGIGLLQSLPHILTKIPIDVAVTMKTLGRFNKRQQCQFSSISLRHQLAEATKASEPEKPFMEDHIRSTLQDLLQICSRKRTPMEGKACHARFMRAGLETDTLTSNMLINMYSKCGLVGCARKVFDEMPQRSLVSWNTLIGAYTRAGEEEEAISLWVHMQREGIRFGEVTLSTVLSACAGLCSLFVCKNLHAFAVKAAMDLNVFVATALLDVYAKSGLIKDAALVFESMPERSSVTWSSMMAGYVQNEHYQEALVLFHRARVMGLVLDQFIVSSAVCACAGLASVIEGSRVHALLFKTGLDVHIFVACSLIDMYAKSGSVKDAYKVFVDAEEKNVVLWNAMISGFAKHARSTEAMILYEKMQQVGIRPNEKTYNSVLSACSHMGLVERGRKYFDLMIREHNVSPNAFHYSCMVDILGRSGLINEALKLLERMPCDATASIWGSLLASCRIHGNHELAEVAAKHLFEMEPDNEGNYILLSNIYAANKMWEEVARVRKLIKGSKLKKNMGKSWIQIKDKVHSFNAGETNHTRVDEIYMKLDNLVEELKKLGYEVETEHDLHDVEETTKQELLRHHSEKLALTFGHMCMPPGAPIRIMKNLRICGDCHSFMKFASSIIGREIIVRDTFRFHHFKDGFCSCRDFW